jgi:hypothetical protein
MIVGLTIVAIGAMIALELAWRVHRIRAQKVKRLRALGFEPCARCGLPLMRPIAAVAAKGPLYCRCCAGEVQ